MKSFIGWIGGKSKLAGDIVGLFPKHKTYVEVFGGAGWVLFRKDPAHSIVEVYNDINGDLVNLFRVVKHRPSALVEQLNLVLYSRATYTRFVKEFDQPVEDEVRRAARFIYILKSSFGSKVGASWGYGRTQKAKTIIDLKFIETVRERLQSVYIENNPFEKVIATFDTKDTLFYLDPPYWIEGEKFYQHELTQDDHGRLNEVLRGIKGRFVLSYNDCDAVRDLYHGFNVQTTKDVHYCLNNKRDEARKKSELIITNYE